MTPLDDLTPEDLRRWWRFALDTSAGWLVAYPVVWALRAGGEFTAEDAAEARAVWRDEVRARWRRERSR